MFVIVRMDRDPQKPVIGVGFAVLRLFRGDDADDILMSLLNPTLALTRASA